MKKFILFFSLILVSMFFSACGEDIKITCNYEKIEIALNEEFVLNNEDFDVYQDYEIGFKLKGEGVVELHKSTIVPISAGDAFLEVYLKEKPENFILIGIRVNDGYITETAKPIRDNITINMAENNTNFNKIITDENSIDTPQIIYDSDIIDYDYESGEIVAKKVGFTEVKVVYKKCVAIFNVEVTNEIFATFMSVSDVEVFVNSKGKFDFTIYPSNANRYCFYSNDASISVKPNGEYEILSNNDAIVHYYYFKENGVRSYTKSFKVYVVKPIDGFEMYVSDINGEIPSVLLQGQVYRLNIKIKDLNTTQVSFSDNISVQSPVINDGDESFVNFIVMNTGDNRIVVRYCYTIANETLILEECLDIYVEE